jgi:hypothetical protein
MKTKSAILDRYARTVDQKVIIDIAAGKVEDIYNDMDRYAPYRRKELDQGLVEYLIESAQEIGRHDFVIQFRLATPADTRLTCRAQTSIHNYFHYLIALEFRKLAAMTRSSLIFFAIGMVILFLSVLANQRLADHNAVIFNILAEGLNVAAWVSLWNAIANVLIHWTPHRALIKMYQRIAKAPVLFHEPAPEPR